MKLLILTHDINSQAYQLYNLIFALHSRGHQLELLSFSPPDYSLKFMLNYNKIKVNITHFPWSELFSKYKNGNYDLKAQDLFRQASTPHLPALREQAAMMDCLIFYGLQGAKIASEFQNIRKVLITNESLDPNISSFRSILSFLKRHIDAFICTNLQEESKMQSLGLPSRYLANCIDPTLASFELANSYEISKNAKEEGYTYFTAILPSLNQATNEDNLERLLVACTYLKKRNSNFKLKIYQPAKIEKVLASLDLTDELSFEVWNYSYKQAFTNSDCLINLEKNELSTLYAHKHAQAILSLEAVDYLQEYACGESVQEPEEIANFMQKLMENPTVLSKYQENSLKLYSEKYNFRQNISDLEKAFLNQ